jgi:hypothetical protein
MVSWLPFTKVEVCAIPLKVTVDAVRNPVPLMVSVCDAAPAPNEAGERAVMVGRGLLEGATVTVAPPDFVVSWVDVAVTVAVPEATGVKTPAPLTAPMLAGLTDHVTDELKLPVPATVDVQVDV